MPTHNGLSQEEIWDDSALLQSWGDAVEEYKSYHSILTRGEKFEDILNAPETQDTRPDDAYGRSRQSSSLHNAIEANQDAGESSLRRSHRKTGPTKKTPRTSESDSRPGSQENVERKPSEDVLSSQKPMGEMQGDESMRNLMMSWYWAGYYTGLNEGRTQTKPRFSRD